MKGLIMIDNKSLYSSTAYHPAKAVRRFTAASLLCLPLVMAPIMAGQALAQETQSQTAEPAVEAPVEGEEMAAEEGAEVATDEAEEMAAESEEMTNTDGSESHASEESSESAEQAGEESAEPASEMPELDTAKYQLEKSGDHFIRMNLQTGQMSICKIHAANLVCRMAADDRAALEQEIATLQSRNEGKVSLGKKHSENDEAKKPGKPKDGTKQAQKEHENKDREGKDQEGEDHEAKKPRDKKDRDTAKLNEGRERDKNRGQRDGYLDSEIDKALEYSARAMRKFFDVMKELREDLER